MNIPELNTEIDNLNQQIKAIQAEGQTVWQQVSQLEGQIALIHNNRQEQLKNRQYLELELMEILALGKPYGKLADELTRLQTVTNIPVEKITEHLETEKEALRKQQAQILKQINPLKQRLQVLENAIELRQKLDEADKPRDVQDWMFYEKGYNMHQVDELMQLAA